MIIYILENNQDINVDKLNNLKYLKLLYLSMLIKK